MRVGIALARQAAVLLIAALMTSCGGNDGGSSSLPAPALPVGTIPAPPPPSLAPAAVPGANLSPFGINGSLQLPVFGWVYRKGSPEPVAATPNLVELSWSAPAGTYEARLSEIGSGTLRYSFPGKNSWAFDLIEAGGSKLPVAISLDPGLFWDVSDRSAGFFHWERQGQFADGQLANARLVFGIPSHPASIPGSGSVRYVGHDDSSIKVPLTFDFAAGTMSGAILIAWEDAWGPYEPSKYELTTSDFTRGAVGFTAQFSVPGAPSVGTLSGRFMGPEAAEIALWWKAPILDPYTGQWTTISGVRVARTVCSFYVNSPCPG
jgi:hypothetical protein